MFIVQDYDLENEKIVSWFEFEETLLMLLESPPVEPPLELENAVRFYCGGELDPPLADHPRKFRAFLHDRRDIIESLCTISKERITDHRDDCSSIHLVSVDYKGSQVMTVMVYSTPDNDMEGRRVQEHRYISHASVFWLRNQWHKYMTGSLLVNMPPHLAVRLHSFAADYFGATHVVCNPLPSMVRAFRSANLRTRIHRTRSAEFFAEELGFPCVPVDNWARQVIFVNARLGAYCEDPRLQVEVHPKEHLASVTGGTHPPNFFSGMSVCGNTEFALGMWEGRVAFIVKYAIVFRTDGGGAMIVELGSWVAPEINVFDIPPHHRLMAMYRCALARGAAHILPDPEEGYGLMDIDSEMLETEESVLAGLVRTPACIRADFNTHIIYVDDEFREIYQMWW